MDTKFKEKLDKLLDLLTKVGMPEGSCYRVSICANGLANIYYSSNMMLATLMPLSKDEPGPYVGFKDEEGEPNPFLLGFGSDLQSEINVGIPGIGYDGDEDDFKKAAEHISNYLVHRKMPVGLLH